MLHSLLQALTIGVADSTSSPPTPSFISLTVNAAHPHSSLLKRMTVLPIQEVGEGALGLLEFQFRTAPPIPVDKQYAMIGEYLPGTEMLP